LQNIALSKLRRALSKKERAGRCRVARGSLSWINIFGLERADVQSARFCFHFTTAQLDRIDEARAPIRTSLIITMRSPGLAHLFLRRNFSAAEIAMSGPPAKSMQAGNVPNKGPVACKPPR